MTYTGPFEHNLYSAAPDEYILKSIDGKWVAVPVASITVSGVFEALGHIYNEDVTSQLPLPSGAAFTTSYPYLADTLRVYWNGVRQDSQYFQETDPSGGQFSLNFDTEEADEILVEYDHSTSLLPANGGIIQENNITKAENISVLDFRGNLTVSQSGPEAVIEFAPLEIQEEGETVEANTLSINFSNDFSVSNDGPNGVYIESTTSAEEWVSSSDVWTRVSNTQFVITGVNRTNIYRKGTKLRCMQGAGYKYFYVLGSTFSSDTVVDITGGSDYTLAVGSITDNYYSQYPQPLGFPGWFNFSNGSVLGMSSISTRELKFKIIEGSLLVLYVNVSGTSNSTLFRVQTPVLSSNTVGWYISTGFRENAGSDGVAGAFLPGASNEIQIHPAITRGTGWTASGRKTAIFAISYYI